MDDHRLVELHQLQQHSDGSLGGRNVSTRAAVLKSEERGIESLQLDQIISSDEYE